MHFTLHLTDACNLRCRYCYVRQSNHYMTLDTAKAVVDLAAEDPGHHGLIFFGGEPLLQRQLIYDTVAYAQSLSLPGKFHYKIQRHVIRLGIPGLLPGKSGVHRPEPRRHCSGR